MKIRCKNADGQVFTLQFDQDPANVTFGQLLQSIQRQSGHLEFKLKQGVPPHSLLSFDNNLTLQESGIRHGDSLLMVPISGSTSSVPSSNTASSLSTPSRQPASTTTSQPNIRKENTRIMKRIEIPDDNSCLFNSVGFVLLGQDTNQAGLLRNIVAETVSSDKTTYSEVFLGMLPERYSSKILSPDVWGGAIELSIFAQYFQSEIVAIDVENLTPLIFGISYSLSLLDGEGSGFKQRVYLLYSGIHYDAVALTDNGLCKTTFDVKDDIAFAEALAVAEEERKARRFTNTNTFTLQCGVCRIAVKGQAEAQDHAAKTGHVDFQEYSA